jgi:tRNA(fMet)-specific endonuclease VapC
MAAGGSMTSRQRWEAFVASFLMLPVDREAAWHYGVTYRYLRANGLLISANDLWIAAVGLAHDMSVVSRNAREFARVPGLNVISY